MRHHWLRTLGRVGAGLLVIIGIYSGFLELLVGQAHRVIEQVMGETPQSEVEAYLGAVRRRDIMRGLEPEFLVSKPLPHGKALFNVEMDANLPEMFFDRLISGIVERAKLPVSEVMRPVNVTIDFHDHIIKAIYEMVDSNLSLLPVLKAGRVVGVLRSVDVFQEVRKLLLGPEEVAGQNR